MRICRIGKQIFVQGEPAGSVPTVALLLTRPSSLWEPPEAQRLRLLGSLVY
jgi:hypothetical protein